ncbi:MAG TPA: thiamine pyrophosphate-dependent enzyme [Planctomycetota bacterium]|jgi:pyruvate dehydrogenase E1 component alpha subunit
MPATAKKSKSKLRSRAVRKSRRPVMPSLFVRALEISNEEAALMLRQMFSIRLLEKKLHDLSGSAKPAQSGRIPLPAFYSGKEAVAVGACSVLRPDDFISITEGGHAHYLARGLTLKALLATAAGRATGCGSGKSDLQRLPFSPPGNLGRGDPPLALGAALACKLAARQQVAACFVGDGAASDGAFHETLAAAAAWEVPLIFVCESEHSSRTREALHVRAQAYGIEGVSCDGSHVLEVRESVAAACARARDGQGPTLIEATVKPIVVGAEDEDGVDGGKPKEPIELFRIVLAEAEAVSPAAADAMEEEVSGEVDAAVKYALEQSPLPDASELLRGIYKGWSEGPAGLVHCEN